MLKIKTFTTISDRIQFKRDQTIYIDSKKPTLQFPSFTIKKSINNGYIICNCPSMIKL
jgi:hypothetical protein